jgi:hypothetical protein
LGWVTLAGSSRLILVGLGNPGRFLQVNIFLIVVEVVAMFFGVFLPLLIKLRLEKKGTVVWPLVGIILR